MRRYSAPACAAAAQAAAGVVDTVCNRRNASTAALREGGRCTVQKASCSALSSARASTQPNPPSPPFTLFSLSLVSENSQLLLLLLLLIFHAFLKVHLPCAMFVCEWTLWDCFECGECVKASFGQDVTDEE